MLPRVVLHLERGPFRLDRDEGRACSCPSPKQARFTTFCDLTEEAAAPAPVSLIPHRPLILDVRLRDEFDAGHLLGALNISLSELADRLAELPHAREVVA